MSRKKDLLSGVLVAFVLLLVGVAAVYVLWPQLQPHATLRLGDGIFTAKIANTDAERAQGLSNTDQLPANQAMIFIFDKDDKWPMWMKDMSYPIDILWLNKDKQVVYIVKNASPDSYPDKFVPSSDARYVIELPAGTVDSKAIRTNDSAVFDNVSGTGGTS